MEGGPFVVQIGEGEVVAAAHTADNSLDYYTYQRLQRLIILKLEARSFNSTIQLAATASSAKLSIRP